MAERVKITNERFVAHSGEITKVEHPEKIKHKYSTYYKYFNEDGTPKRKGPEDNGDQD